MSRERAIVPPVLLSAAKKLRLFPYVRLWTRKLWVTAAIGSLTLLGLALRLPSPDRQLEYDEVVSILFAQKSFSQIVLATAADTMPPLYYWLLHLGSPGGENLFLARFWSTLLGVLSIPVFYLLGRRLVETGDAVGATALLAFSPFHMFYSHYARMYALLTFLGLLETFFFVRWLQENRKRDLLLFTLSAGISLYVHHLAFLLVLALDALFLLGYRGWSGDRRGRVTALLLAHLALALALLPWLVYLPGQLAKVARAFWILPPGLTELVRTALVFHFHLPLPGPLLGAGAFLSLLLLVITFLEVRRRWAQHREERPALLILATLAVAPVALMFLISQVYPIYVERGAMVSSAVYYLLLVSSLRWLSVRSLAWGLWTTLGVGIILAHLYQHRYEEFPRSPFQAVGQYLVRELRPGDMVLHDNKLSFFPTYFFARGLPQGYVADVPGSPNDTLAPGSMEVLGLYPTTPAEAAQGHQRLWFVVFQRALGEAEAAGVALPNKAWLDQRYPGEFQERLGDVYLYLYHLGR